MARKKIHRLSESSADDFKIICIASHQSDYRLSWALNEKLNFRFVKTNDLQIKAMKGGSLQKFSRYSCSDTNQATQYTLIGNKSQQGFLFPDMKNIDFFLKVEGVVSEQLLHSLVKRIKEIELVLTAFVLEPLQQKHRKKLIF